MKISNLIYREDKWCKGCLATTKEGRKLQNLNVHHYDGGREINPASTCVSFSLYGAVVHLYGGNGQGDISARLGDAVRKYTKSNVYLAAFNDDESTTFEDIQNVLKIANL